MPIRYGNSKTDKILYNGTQVKKILKDGQLVFQNNKAYYYLGGYKGDGMTVHNIFKLNDKLEVIASHSNNARELLSSCFFGDDVLFAGYRSPYGTDYFNAYGYSKKIDLKYDMSWLQNNGRTRGCVSSKDGKKAFLVHNNIISRCEVSSVSSDVFLSDKSLDIDSRRTFKGIVNGYSENKETFVATTTVGYVYVFDYDLNIVTSFIAGSTDGESGKPLIVYGGGLKSKYIGFCDGSLFLHLLKYNTSNSSYGDKVSYSLSSIGLGSYRDVAYNEKDNCFYVLGSSKVAKFKISDNDTIATISLVSSNTYSNGWGINITHDGNVMILCDNGLIEIRSKDNLNTTLASKKIPSASMFRTSVVEKL